jgi:hypothetical protein
MTYKKPLTPLTSLTRLTHPPPPLLFFIGEGKMLSKIQCLDCKLRLTWAERRRQFGRIIKRGHPPELAKQLMPRCQKCVTSLLEKPEWISAPSDTSVGVRSRKSASPQTRKSASSQAYSSSIFELKKLNHLLAQPYVGSLANSSIFEVEKTKSQENLAVFGAGAEIAATSATGIRSDRVRFAIRVPCSSVFSRV